MKGSCIHGPPTPHFQCRGQSWGTEVRIATGAGPRLSVLLRGSSKLSVVTTQTLEVGPHILIPEVRVRMGGLAGICVFDTWS